MLGYIRLFTSNLLSALLLISSHYRASFILKFTGFYQPVYSIIRFKIKKQINSARKEEPRITLDPILSTSPA